jgi:hypothetical protein
MDLTTKIKMTDEKAFGLITARIKKINQNLEYRKSKGMPVDYGERDSLLWLLDKIRQFSLRFLKGLPTDIELKIRDLEARIEDLTNENRNLIARLNKKNKKAAQTHLTTFD